MTSITNQSATILTQHLLQRHIHFNTCTSTNTELMNAILTGQQEASQTHLFTADTQTVGRGQGSNSWLSPKGNVYLSLYYPTQHTQFPLTKPISGLLSLCIGYFLSQLPIIQQINHNRQGQALNPIGVKWANDIGYYDEYGLFYKLSGILIEPVIKQGNTLGLIVGVGLNVTTAPALTSSQTPEYQSISLVDCVPNKTSHYDCHTLYQPISHAIFQGILTHQQISIESLALADFLSSFASVDVLRGRHIRVKQQVADKQQTLMGQAIGIDKFGCLQLADENGKVQGLFTGKIQVITSH